MSLRVLMTADTVGGVWQYALELATGLAEQGAEVVLATLGRPLQADQRQAASAVPGLMLHESSYRLEWMRDPWGDLDRAAEWLLELAATSRPDVVHLNHYCHGALDWPAPVLMVAHSCVYSWFVAVHGKPPGAEWERYRNVVARGLAGADLVVAPSASMLASVERHYGRSAATQVIPNGRCAAQFPPGVKQPRIFASGRLWDEAKNIAMLARVAPRLDWPVRVAGAAKGPDGQGGDFGNVEQCGRLDAACMAREYASASIYAAPARYEPFGLGILEAALAGCALVLGDVSSLREIWGRDAAFVAPDDDEGLIATLNGLARDPPALASLAQRSHRRALRYGRERMSAGYLEAYRHVRSECMPRQSPLPTGEGVRERGINR